MSPAEVAAFLDEQLVVTCATLGPRGFPHLMPLWYVMREVPGAAAPGSADPPPDTGPQRRIWAWTYAASQKVRNLQRDPRATLLVEAGVQYQELQGVMFECEVIVHTELRAVTDLGLQIFGRYAPPGEQQQELGAVVEGQAAKRVGLEFIELRRASWDHRKLAGTY